MNYCSISVSTTAPVPVPFTCRVFRGPGVVLVCEEATGIGVVCDASIKDAYVSSEVSIYIACMRHSDRMHAPWPCV